jgi:hypothetical protein
LSTPAQKVLRTQGQFLSWPQLLAHLEVLRAESVAGVADRIRSEVKEIVPQYQWQQTDGKVEIRAEMAQVSQLYIFDRTLANAHD